MTDGAERLWAQGRTVPGAMTGGAERRWGARHNDRRRRTACAKTQRELRGDGRLGPATRDAPTHPRLRGSSRRSTPRSPAMGDRRTRPQTHPRCAALQTLDTSATGDGSRHPRSADPLFEPHRPPARILALAEVTASLGTKAPRTTSSRNPCIRAPRILQTLDTFVTGDKRQATADDDRGAQGTLRSRVSSRRTTPRRTALPDGTPYARQSASMLRGIRAPRIHALTNREEHTPHEMSLQLAIVVDAFSQHSMQRPPCIP